MIKSCPRCGQSFSCSFGEIETCFCSSISLSEETRVLLQKTNYDCLCSSCLDAYEILAMRVKALPPYDVSQPLQEGIHYYLDQGKWVFTELYQAWKGYCCEQICRHCVYGFKSKPHHD